MYNPESDKSESPREQRRAKYLLTAVLAAIGGSRGAVQKVALALQCDWHTARRYVDRWSKTQEAFEGEANRVLDIAESLLIEAVKRGEPWAIKLLLLTKSKRRGYTLRTELAGMNGAPIQAQLIAPRRFDSAEDWQRYVQEVPQLGEIRGSEINAQSDEISQLE